MNRDKKSICLVCKEMAIVGTPLLYRHVVIDEQLNKDLESTLSSPEAHHGLIHIRTLRINTRRFDDCDFDGHERSPVITAIYSLLRAIPEDALTRFE